jgi:peptidoglycan/LPS O-acetylase OafA/YrhL
MRRVSVESAVRFLIAAGVGAIGAAAGFTHTHQAAYESGQHGWLAWADAVVIECMVIVAGLQLATDRKEGRSGGLAMTVLIVAFLIQMGAQVSGAPRNFAGWLFAALPALGCLVVVKFAFRSGHRPATESTSAEPRRAVTEWVDLAEPVREIQRTRDGMVPAPAAAWPPANG